jgi:hypothetical protein
MSSTRRFPIHKLLLGTLLVLAVPQLALAAQLRGRLVYQNGAPAAGLAVTVYSQAIGRSVPAYTDATGMYYLNIPPGAYYLEVWISRDPRVQPQVYPIQVAEPYTDIPPIVIG